MNWQQLLKDFSKIIATMRKIFGDFRFIEYQNMLRQFVNRDDPFYSHFLSHFIDVFMYAVEYTNSIEDARIMQLIIRLLLDYVSTNLVAKEEQELCLYIQRMKIPYISLRYARAEKNYVYMYILNYLSKQEQKLFYSVYPELKPRAAHRAHIDVSLDDANEARFNLQNNIKGLTVLIYKEILATQEELIALENEYCEANNLYYSRDASCFVPPVVHKLRRLLNAFQQREMQHQNSNHSQSNIAANFKHLSNLRASSDDNNLAFTFELDNPLLMHSYDDEDSLDSEINFFYIMQDGILQFDFHSTMAAFSGEEPCQQRLAVISMQGQVLYFLQKTLSLLDYGLPSSYYNAVLFMIKLVSSLINYTYYYSYTKNGTGLINYLIYLQHSPFYQDLQILIYKLNQYLILDEKLELWQKLFMPIQRGYICTYFSIISNCISVLCTVAKGKLGDNQVADLAVNSMKVEFHDGKPINAAESPINLNKESIPILQDSNFYPIYRPYLTKQTINCMVVLVQVLTQYLIYYTLITRFYVIYLVFPDYTIFDQAAKCLKTFKFSEDFLKMTKTFECESFGFLQVERQFYRSNYQSIAKQRSSPSKEAIECSSLSTNSIVHNSAAVKHDAKSSLKNSQSGFDYFSLVNQPQIEDFTPLSYIARGGFGCVILVNYKRTNTRMIMKIMRKSDIVRKNYVDRIRMEKQILYNIEEYDINSRLKDFVVKFYGSFRSGYYLFLLLEYMQYGNLSQMLSACGAFPEDIARYYVGEIAIALSLMHYYGIIYNDLKPENLLLSAYGHIKFTDFGLSNVVISQIQPSVIDEYLAYIEEAYTLYNSEPSRAYCFEENAVVYSSKKEQEQKVVGTPNYLAPELLRNKSPTAASDFWSLGVCMYEFLYGCKPFHGYSPQEIFQAELEQEPQYFDEVSEDAISLMQLLLAKDPERRISNVQQLKQHPFFKTFEFFDILSRYGPYVPTVKFEGSESMIKVNSENWIDDVIRESGLVQDFSSDIGTQSDDGFSGYSFYKEKEN